MMIPARYVSGWTSDAPKAAVDTVEAGLCIALRDPPVEMFGQAYVHLGHRGVELERIEEVDDARHLWRVIDYVAGSWAGRAQFARSANVYLRWWDALDRERYVLPIFLTVPFTVDWSAVAIAHLWSVHSTTIHSSQHREREHLPETEMPWWDHVEDLYERWTASCPLLRAPRPQVLELKTPGSLVDIPHVPCADAMAREALHLYETCPFRTRYLH